MTSCEPGRTRACGEDLRWRIVWQREALGKKCKDVASNLGVDPATVSRVVTRFRETGHVLKKSHPSRRVFRKLTMGVEMMILHIVLRRPGIYLHEVARELNETLGAEVALSTICMFLKKCGFTRQKLRLSAIQSEIQRDSFLRLQFVSEVSLYDRDMMIFLDETGSDRRNSIRKYGYSIRGRPLVSEKLLVRGKRISAIAFMSVNGTVKVLITVPKNLILIFSWRFYWSQKILLKSLVALKLGWRLVNRTLHTKAQRFLFSKRRFKKFSTTVGAINRAQQSSLSSKWRLN